MRVLRASKPWVLEVRTQIDYFNTIGLGIQRDQLALAKRLGLLVVPRFQNDERFAQPQIAADIGSVLGSGAKVSTVIFFGLRNEVLGYPDHLEDAAAVFRSTMRSGESESSRLISERSKPTTTVKSKKAAITLARAIEGQTVRVQAIAKTELDKITLDDVVARYVLGVRERNIRVVYLRPWAHQDGKSFDRSHERRDGQGDRRPPQRPRFQTGPRDADSAISR